MEGSVMLVLIILGGVVCLLGGMAINDALVYRGFPVVISNLIPMGFLIAGIVALMFLIATA